eukprot:scaffold10375_cov123-Skeletonema_menzelii.AAC.1
MAKSSENHNDASYNHLASSLSVSGLFNDFSLPARLLRLAREKSDFPADDVFACTATGNDVINTFYELLDKVETAFTNPSSQEQLNLVQQDKFIIEVEGLDGSGKTTLVKKLQDTLPHAIATKTPTASLHDIRPLWDKRGGILARAFYMISNYVLEYEIANFYKEDIIIIDRWYASTCGYTVARPPHDSNSHGNDTLRKRSMIADMPQAIFDWPKDLRLRPHILLVLQIDQSERQKRVDNRARGAGDVGGGASRFNPWDERLAKDTALGERILEALHRIRGPVETYSINANFSIEDVMKQALDVIKLPMERHLKPQVHFASHPLQWWIYMAQKLNCCDEHGKRTHRALWNLQVSYNNKNSGPIPVLKTVGLDRIDIDSNFVYYWTARNAFPCNESLWGAAIWEGGAYPTEFQWRVEGYLRRVTEEERILRGYRAPRSLVAHVTACLNLSDNVQRRNRMSRPDSYDDAVHDARKVRTADADCVCMVRLVPIRIEVLRGGPSTRLPGYPQRWEWSRRSNENEGAEGGWIMRSILPFGSTPRMTAMRFRDLTICIVGTHTSGKSTIGRKLAKLLGCQFDEELGETERDSESLVEGGHLHGDGSSTTTSTSPGQEDWDAFLHGKECERDTLFQDSKSSVRVVETWHIGNAAWYNLRHPAADVERYKIAITKHQESSLVVVIQLMLASPSTMVRRREVDVDNTNRLPMQDDEKECNQLFIALQDNNLKGIMLEPLGIPVLQVDNSADGGKAMEKVLIDILTFVQKHFHSQVVMSSS